MNLPFLTLCVCVCVCAEMSPLTAGAEYERLQEIMCPKLQKKIEHVFRLEVISDADLGGESFPEVTADETPL